MNMGGTWPGQVIYGLIINLFKIDTGVSLVIINEEQASQRISAIFRNVPATSYLFDIRIIPGNLSFLMITAEDGKISHCGHVIRVASKTCNTANICFSPSRAGNT